MDHLHKFGEAAENLLNAWSKLRLGMYTETILLTTATLELSIDLLGMLGLL
jgi:hypothetical protein